MQHEAIEQIIERFSLMPHPEGGFYKRVYESEQIVEFSSKMTRKAMTSIYYLLAANDFSTFHRLDASEIWHYYQGTTTLILHKIDPQGNYQKMLLGPSHNHFQLAIPAHCWFAVELSEKNKDHYALVGCTVAPGFEFQYFEMAERETLCQQFPEHRELIYSLTREKNLIST